MGLFDDDPIWGQSSSYGALPPDHPLNLTVPPEGAIFTEDIGLFSGPLPGDPGFTDPGLGGMAWAGVKEGLFAPVAGLAERAGILKEGTRQGIREDFEETRLRYLSEDPSLLRATLAGASEILPSAIPYAPAGTTAKLATTIAPRLAKYGLQGTKLADPKILSRALAAGGGAAVGLGETTGGTPLEQALGLGLGAGLGTLAGSLKVPDGGIIDRVFREEGILDDTLGPSSGYTPALEKQRISAAYKATAYEQEALIELNRAEAIAKRLGMDAEETRNLMGDALRGDTSSLGRLPDEIQESVGMAREVLDRQSRTLIEPGGKVYDNYYSRAEKVSDLMGAEPREIMEWVDDEIGRMMKSGTLDQEAASLPPELAEVFQTGLLKRTIEENQGEYMARSYQAFFDPEYAQRRFREIKDLKSRSTLEDLAPEEVKLVETYDLMMESVMRGKDGGLLPHYQGPGGELKAERKLFNMMDRSTASPFRSGRGKIPATEWGELKRRSLTDKEPDVWIRTLLGEDEDPFNGLMRSIRKITSDQEAYTFKKQLAQTLVERGEASSELIPGRFDYKVDGLQEAGVPPVYMADPKKAAELGQAADSMAGGTFDALNYLSKTMATVLNPVTHGRNIIANPAFLTMNGINPMSVLKPGNIRESRQMLRMLDQDPSKALAKMSRAELDEFKEGSILMMERGLMENVDVSDLNRFLDDIRRRSALTGKTTLGELVGNATNKVTRSKLLGDPGKKYAYEDFFFKNMGYQLEKRRLGRTGAFNDDEIRELTLDSLETMLPTYSKRSKITEKFRRAQVIAPFVNFYSELVRTAKQTFQKGMQQFFDPEAYLTGVLGQRAFTDQQVSAIRKLGAKRLAGISATMAAPFALQKMSQVWNGVSAEEDQAARSFMPPWSKDNPVFYYNYNNGEFDYVDLGHIFPHAALIKPGELAEPFTSPTIPISEAFEAYNDLTRVSELSPTKKAEIIAKRGFRAFAPGFLKWGERIAKGASGLTNQDSMMQQYFPNKNRYGKEYELTKELMSPLGRPTRQNVVDGLKWKARGYARADRQAKDIVNQSRNQGTNNILNSIETARGEHRQSAEDLIKYVEDARTLGSSEEEIRSMMMGLDTIPRADVELLLRGIIPTFRQPSWSR